MEEFYGRLLVERTELTERIKKLESFFSTAAFARLNDIQSALLLVQLQAMKTYEQCLHERIADLQAYYGNNSMES